MAVTPTYRVNQLAKDLNIKSKDMLDFLTTAGIQGKTHMAVLEPDEFAHFLDELTKQNQINKIDDYLSGKTIIGKPEVKTDQKEKAKEKAPAKTVSEETKPEIKPEPKPEAPQKEQANQVQQKPEDKTEVNEINEAPKPQAAQTAAAEAAKPESVKQDDTPRNNPPVQHTQQQSPQFNHNNQQGQRPQYNNNNHNNQQGQRPQYNNNNNQQGQRPQYNNNNHNNQQGQRPQYNNNNNQQGQRPQYNNNNQNNQQSQRPQFNNNQQGQRPQYNNNNHNNQQGQRPQFNNNNNQTTQQSQRPQFNNNQSNQPKKLAQPEVTKKRTGTTRVVDTRTTNVDLAKYDENFDKYVSDSVNDSSTKQKLKKQNTRDPYSKNRMSDKERLAMEKLRKANAEKFKKQQLSITVPDEISVGELAVRLKVTAAEVVKRLMIMGVMATVNQIIDYDTAYLVADELGAKVTKEVVLTIEEKLFDEIEDTDDNLVERSPVVVVMGHVDHGKTSLLDAIRHTKVTTGEAGGITQHIGAYRVSINGKEITFLDTPGHAAFTAMRARGAQATDIAILVVAADDGIMPQTVEAINHARAAGVDIIVAINKMDKPTADPDTVKQTLTNYNLVPEEWGGDVICVPVSAITGKGIDDLLENVLLVAEMAELKANPDRRAKGIVIEAKLDKGRGPVATVLVQNGTLRSGDIVIAGTSVGRVRAMTDDSGNILKEAGPSVPVEIIGLAEVPSAGDEFNAVEDERMARELAEQRRNEAKEEVFKANAKINLDDLFAQISQGIKELPVIVKADVGGSAEAVKSSLEKLSNDEVKVSIIHTGVGGITENDVMFASASNAIIVGFNVRPDKSAIDSADRQKVDIRTYRIIYECIEEIEAAMKGMLAPTFKEVVLGHAEVRQTIHVPNVGTIAGSYVQDGKITRNSQIRVVRDGIVIFEDKISSLKRFKDDMREVASGYECGVGLDRFNDIREKDILESFIMEEVAR
ncbi:translation initiation factor if-2-related [Holotrichia oblita]|nr:translation initiation factor if-2-related [Holotrichia oblita]